MSSCTQKPTIARREVTRLSAATLLLAAFGGTRRADAAEPTLGALDAMQRDGRFDQWLDLIDHAGLTRYMTGQPPRSIPFTMFAPTNEALTPYKDDLLAELRLNTPFPDNRRVTRLIRSYTLPGLHPLSEFSGKKILLNGFSGNPIQLNGQNPNSPQVILLVGAMKSKNTIDPKPIVANNAIVFALSSVDIRMINGW